MEEIWERAQGVREKVRFRYLLCDKKYLKNELKTIIYLWIINNSECGPDELLVVVERGALQVVQ